MKKNPYKKLFKNYLFRCSDLPKLMVTPKLKTEELSQTTKSYLRELWIKEVYKRDRGYKTINKFTQKGIMVESDSLKLFKQATRKAYFKNNTELANAYIKGTPDVKRPLIDLKASWDIWTFGDVNEADAKKDYFWQLLGYAWLTKQRKGSLVYTLTNTPEMLKNDELYKLSFKMPEEETKKYENNFEFDDIPVKDRIKKFNFDFCWRDILALRKKIIISRQYMATITL